MKRAVCLTAVAAMAITPVFAQFDSESVRTLYTHENRMPALNSVEVGLYADYYQFEEVKLGSTDFKRQEYTVTPYARYGLLPNLTLNAAAPVGRVKSDLRDSTKTGFRDLAVGLELLAYEYTYKYPWVIPWGTVTFPTGNEDDGLGLGKTDGIIGTSCGTTVYDVYHYAVDGWYDVNVNADNNDGMFGGAVSFVWDLSDQFSVLAEAEITEQPSDSDKGVPGYFNGGMSYRPTDKLTINWYGGTAVNSDEDGHFAVKIAYCF